MGLFGNKKSMSSFQKINMKEAKMLNKRYGTEAKSFVAGLSQDEADLFNRYVGLLIDESRPYEDEAGYPTSLLNIIRKTAAKIKTEFGSKAVLYAYVLFAEAVPMFAPHFEDEFRKAMI